MSVGQAESPGNHQSSQRTTLNFPTSAQRRTCPLLQFFLAPEGSRPDFALLTHGNPRVTLHERSYRGKLGLAFSNLVVIIRLMGGLEGLAVGQDIGEARHRVQCV